MAIAEGLQGNRVQFRLEGTFDSAEAWQLHDALAKVAPGSVVALDFSQVRSFHDFAIALLARDLLALRGRVAATGLCQHQHRVLRYFGVDDPELFGPSEEESPPPPSNVADYL
jgi:anti-anti-sigma regulatory factor